MLQIIMQIIYISDVYIFSKRTHSSNNGGHETKPLTFRMQDGTEITGTASYLQLRVVRTQRAQRHHNSPEISLRRFQMWKKKNPTQNSNFPNIFPHQKCCTHERGISKVSKLPAFFFKVKMWFKETVQRFIATGTL